MWLWNVESPTFSRQFAHKWQWGYHQPYTPAALYPKEDSWYSFLLEAKWTPGSQCSWRDWVNWKNPMTSGIEPMTSWHEALFSFFERLGEHILEYHRLSLKMWSSGLCLSIRLSPTILMNVMAWEHFALDNYISGCGEMYYSDSTIIPNFI
jgi:hypothetical protein